MSPELSYKLVKRFPILYQNFGCDPRQSCMAWGFEHGDGWFLIIWQLSLALNEELGYETFTGKIRSRWLLFKKRFFKHWNDFIYKLSPVVHDKQKMIGTGVKGDPLRWVVVEKAKPVRPWLKKFVRFPNTGFAVDQVKEKFGGLRYYCPGNDRIYALVGLAERLADVTCEVCGKPGKTESPGGWMSTVCKEHSKLPSVEED